MLETPHITQSAAQQAAVIHLTIPRNQVRTGMGPAIQEVIEPGRDPSTWRTELNQPLLG